MEKGHTAQLLLTPRVYSFVVAIKCHRIMLLDIRLLPQRDSCRRHNPFRDNAARRGEEEGNMYLCIKYNTKSRNYYCTGDIFLIKRILKDSIYQARHANGLNYLLTYKIYG